MVKRGWIPPRSPFGLIQEDLWSPRAESEWLILVTCIMLNCTSRKQVEGVLPEFISRWPTPQRFLTSDRYSVVELCKPLGFANRRTDNLLKMTRRFVSNDWTHARELPGIGEYAARAWEMFCMGELGDEPPRDGALTVYYGWLKQARST